ncbi:MAG: response regulator [Chloroflexi bacterium]|nr:response regulator [Chloroflexota bacterium]
MKQNDQGYLLVADDNEMNRDMLSRRLEREGYRVAVAEDGNRTLAVLQAERFDLVLLDVMMPGLNGFEVLQIIRQKQSIAELPVIMATARDESEDIIAGFKLGANDYVTKPINFPVLLARVQTQLQLKRLTEFKDQFLQIASHDLKNPLSNILMSAYVIQQVVTPGEVMTGDIYATLGLIVKQGKTMQRIITDFLDFQALQDGRLRLDLKLADLNQIARRVVEENTEYAQSKSIEVQLALEEHLPEVMGDETRLAQVIQNLVGNAIKFCPTDATAIIRTSIQDNSVVLEVCDSGPGLSEADLAKAFTKYARLSNKPTGGEKSSGLGLSICRQMIELQAGTIGVRNNPEHGTTFWFNLPVTSSTAFSETVEAANKLSDHER